MLDILASMDLSLLAQAEIFDTNPQAPQGFIAPVTTLIGIVRWVGFLLVGIGLIVVLASMAISRREGSSEEVTGNFIRVGFAAMGLGAVGSIMSLLIG